MKRLFEIHAEMLFEHGIANADPHAGNVLILDPEEESLGITIIVIKHCQ